MMDTNRDKALRFLHAVDDVSFDGSFRSKLSGGSIVWEMTVDQLMKVYSFPLDDAEKVIQEFLATPKEE
jgi:hypothetical protein